MAGERSPPSTSGRSAPCLCCHRERQTCQGAAEMRIIHVIGVSGLRRKSAVERSPIGRTSLGFRRVISNEQMQHGRPWRGEDVSGWFACEKLDGCRGYWDG